MREQIEQRIKELKAEFEAGQKMLADLETQQARIRETMLRISGAVQALEELLAPPAETTSNNHLASVPVPE
jgi:predicted nuclease with TOPRIM domain